MAALEAIDPQAPGRSILRSPTLTFAKDIAPILYARCSHCHRPGGPAPFSLLTYADVKKHARLVATAVKSRLMPPWKPEPGYGEFQDERRLSNEEIARVERWIDEGAREGDPSMLPPVPRVGDGWQQGPPDVVLTLPSGYRLRADGPDVFRNFVISIPVSVRRYVRAWEFRSGNSAVIHHATLLLDRSRASRQRDEEDPEPGYEGLIPLTAQNPDGYFLGWTPGQSPQVSPAGMPWILETDTDLVVMLHLRPSGKEELVQFAVGLYFTDVPPWLTPLMIRLCRQDIEIPAGERRYTVTNSYSLPVDADAYAVQPHAHNLAKTIKAIATLPDGTRKWLIYIKSWDFNWQDSYRFRTPIFLPAGTALTMEITYDNSADNPRNPHRPPQRVLYGQRTSDEMGDLWVQVVPRRAADLARLRRDFEAKLLPETIAGYKMMLRADPDNGGLHDDLALLYRELGDWEQMAAQFAESLRIRPASPAAHYNFGMSLLALGNRDEAADAFRDALRLESDYALGHYGLGLALQAAGRLEEAIAQYGEALKLDPSDADVHYNLAGALNFEGRKAEALHHYRLALQHRADWTPALLDLAWLLATSSDPQLRQPDEALRLAKRAVEVSKSRTARLLDVLAAALATSGDFAQAVTVAQDSLRIASAAHDAGAATAIRERLVLYSRRQAYQEDR
jgi:tetratricopeptide (TPR) repeat protein